MHPAAGNASLSLPDRIVVAGTRSGVGKTTVATGLLAAFAAKGRAVASAKVGPDFIDPGYHHVASGRPGRNLDPWICGVDSVGPMAAHAAGGADLLVVEGVMGLFDGAEDESMSSTADVAAALQAPVLLVVDASGVGHSIAAEVAGFRQFRSDVSIAGVIINRVGSDRHERIVRSAVSAVGTPIVGVIRQDDSLGWRDRHLGLVPVNEQPKAVTASVRHLGRLMTASCDLDQISQVAQTAPVLRFRPPRRPERRRPSVVVAVAAGAAFSFTYEDNLEALTAAGAELQPFDPLVDETLPANTDGLVIGGGFPEVYAERLATNDGLLSSIRRHVQARRPVWAECGGLMLLADSVEDHRLAGVVRADVCMRSRPTLGYRTAIPQIDTLLGSAGSVLRGHEFHYSSTEPSGAALRLVSATSERLEGFGSPAMLATYLHQHWGDRPDGAVRFVTACRSKGADC